MLPLAVVCLLALRRLDGAGRGFLGDTVVAAAAAEGVGVGCGRRHCMPVLDVREKVYCRLAVYAW